MRDVSIACPRCHKRLKTTRRPAVGQRLHCPGCDHAFAVRQHDLTPAPAARPPVLVARPFAPPPGAVTPVAAPRPASPPAPELLPETADGGKAVLTVVAVAALFLAGGVGFALALSFGGKKEEGPVRTADAGNRPADDGDDPKGPSPSQPPKKGDPPPPDKGKPPPSGGGPSKKPPADPGLPDPPPAEEPPAQRPKPPAPATPVAVLPPEEQAKVDRAIDKGVQFLKKRQQASGTWAGHHASGLAALPGLTLLECGVPAGDPAVKKAADFVRRAVPRERNTYNLALMILFLDRLGDPGDRRIIQILALRLAAGQRASGGWTYTCPLLDDKDTHDLFAYLDKERPKDPQQLFAQDRGDRSMAFFVPDEPGGQAGTARPAAPPPPEGADPATLPFDRLPPRDLPRDQLPARLRDLPVVRPLPRAADLPGGDGTDNSNTQFAVLGVWAAGRHGVPTERTLALLVKRFRKSQNRDGTWHYLFSTSGQGWGTPAMTCSGLLGLAVGHGLIAGASPSKRPSAKDPAIKKGLEALAVQIGRPLGAAPAKGGKRPVGRPAARSPINLYFLWSVERVGVLYNLRTIADKDWYHWGAELLVDHQHASGGWFCGGYPGSSVETDTCFALLFLKRANLARDLSQKLQFLIDVRESK